MPLIAHPHILDIETSGFGPHSYPIEVGDALGIDERFSTLIKPAPGWTHWDDQAERVHRISRQTLSEFGKPAMMTSAIWSLAFSSRSNLSVEFISAPQHRY